MPDNIERYGAWRGQFPGVLYNRSNGVECLWRDAYFFVYAVAVWCDRAMRLCFKLAKLGNSFRQAP